MIIAATALLGALALSALGVPAHVQVVGNHNETLRRLGFARPVEDASGVLIPGPGQDGSADEADQTHRSRDSLLPKPDQGEVVTCEVGKRRRSRAPWRCPWLSARDRS
jgi:hypothetical protein